MAILESGSAIEGAVFRFGAMYVVISVVIYSFPLFRFYVQIQRYRLALCKKYSSLSTRHGGAWGERRYSSYSFTTSALDGGEWSASRPCRALTPGKGPPVPIVQEAGQAPEPVWTQRLEEKSFAPAGDRTPIALSSSP
jgi:hypothetical protein